MPACAPAWPGRSVRQGQADDGIIGDGGDGLKGHVAGALDGPLVVLFEEDGADEACDGGLVGKDADDLGAALDLAVDPLEGIGNRYEFLGADVWSWPWPWCMVRPSGTEAPGARWCGQAGALDELRARVSSWPPLRLARLRRERGSVGVVSPAAPMAWKGRGDAHATGDRHRHPPDLRGGGDLGGRRAEARRPGGDDPDRARGLRPPAREERRGGD